VKIIYPIEIIKDIKSKKPRNKIRRGPITGYDPVHMQSGYMERGLS